MNNYKHLLVLILFSASSIFAQDTNQEGIGKQEVLVIKSYTPSLSDAFQLKNSPQFPDSLLQRPKKIDYTIQEIPVVSNFQPNKATPLNLKHRNPTTTFNTLFSAGYGNKNQLLMDVSSVYTIDRKQRVGFLFYRDGFVDNVNNSLLKSDQGYSRIGLHHNLRSREYNTHTSLQFKKYKNHYYGLYDQEWDPLLINSIDPKINRNLFEVRTDWNWYDFVLQNIEFQANLTSDNYNSSEQQLGLGGVLNFEIGKSNLNTELNVQALNTVFEQSYYEKTREKYSYGLLDAELQWQHLYNDFKLKLGAGIALLQGETAVLNSLLYYPKIEVIYQKPNAVITPFIQALGGVSINSYRNTLIKNPYLAPTTAIKPTFENYNAALGFRSSLASIINFDVSVIYDNVDNFSYYQRLPFDGQNEDQGYRLSNAFEIKYAQVQYYGVKTAIRLDLAKNNFIHFETKYRFFNSENDQTLWNTPGLELHWNGQFTWRNKLTLSLNGSAFGDRTEAYRPIFINQPLNNVPLIENKLPLFIQSNFHLTYSIAKQFDVFIKNRISSKGIHGRWALLPEPPFLLLSGVLYKFDLQY